MIVLKFHTARVKKKISLPLICSCDKELALSTRQSLHPKSPIRKARGSVISQTSGSGVPVTATLMIIKLEKQRKQAAIQVTAIIFQKVFLTLPPRVVEQITRKSSPASIDEIMGDMNHEATVHSNFVQFIDEAASPASPAPIRAPITVCVPLIGIPKIDETKMNENEERHVPSISLS